MQIVSFVGGRANLIKVAPIHQVLSAAKLHHEVIDIGVVRKPYGVLTYEDLRLPPPNVVLDIGIDKTLSYLEKLQVFSEKIRRAFTEIGDIDLLLVYGDLTSAVAAAIAALQENVPLAHVEAGLRNGDVKDVEEINRLLLDKIADWLFPPSFYARDVLIRERKDSKKVFLIGNTIVEALRTHLKFRREDLLREHGLTPKSYAMVTIHREENLYSKSRFCQLLQGIIKVSKNIKTVFIQYEETSQAFQRFNCPNLREFNNVIVLDTLAYHDYLGLLYNTRIVISDSSGIQDETTFLGIPCITCRNATHRHETISIGSNTLVRANAEELFTTTMKILRAKHDKKFSYPFEWTINFKNNLIEALASISKSL